MISKSEVRYYLSRVQEFLNEHSWCQGSVARDSEGEPTPLYSRSVDSFCIAGVMALTIPLLKQKAMMSQLNQYLAEDLQDPRTVTIYNDAEGRTKAEMLHLVNQVILKNREEVVV